MTIGKEMTSSNTEQVDAAASGDGEAVCYLCLGGGVDDNAGQPLRRDCACRGTDAGFVHFDCLTEYAETKSELADKMSLGMQEFITPWETCPSCHQYYQNELAIDIANKFVSFVRRQYPDDTRR
jgi:E3 ubiquitin-protein ligase DOA10